MASEVYLATHLSPSLSLLVPSKVRVKCWNSRGSPDRKATISLRPFSDLGEPGG
jgi:hypothetical protein